MISNTTLNGVFGSITTYHSTLEPSILTLINVIVVFVIYISMCIIALYCLHKYIVELRAQVKEEERIAKEAYDEVYN